MEPILKDKRILIVEDNVMNMAVYNAILRDSGAIILQDFWNFDTLNMITRFMPVDVILLDLMLRKGVSGYDIFDQIKANPKLAAVPVIAVSAADPGIEIPKAKAKGFNGFIGKPIEPILFPQQIADCLSGKPVWHSQTTLMEKITWPTKPSSSMMF
jgi:CheY-like chemotaxis protein